ncbi:MAG TPA: response regulator [Spirochaetales bacterium]|nr:response regulator [Spirochaetales bacterium]HPD79448.1 response regulator [Spirochaetales bacterium]HQG40407.1 response regulator [Spirochaetales bacterium]HQK33143.1 response regulator [Spirochaetales bacterium]HRV27856.1 response regulator [Spirochaetia bacterium]
MKHILIADDEQPIINGLKLIINKYFYDQYTIVAEAHNGRETIELAEKHLPDIILIDVNMPGINGIEAIRTISKQGITSAFILITAFEKFEIAQEALALGVCDYILKPVSKDRLELALNTASLHIEKLRYLKEKELEYAEREKLHAIYMQEIFFYNLINNKLTKDHIYNFKNAVHITKNFACIILIKIDTADTSNDLLKFLTNFILYKTNALYSSFLFTDCNIILLPLKEKSETELFNFISMLTEEFQHHIAANKLLLFPGTPENFLNINLSWNFAKEKLFSHYYSDTPLQNTLQESDLPLKEFYQTIAEGKYQKAIKLMQDSIETLLLYETDAINNFSYTQLYKLIGMSVCLSTIQTTQSTNILTMDAIKIFHRLWEENHKREALITLLPLLQKLNSSLQIKTNSPLITQALNYIHSHYKEPISLESAAEVLSVSPAHLSRAMKEELGKGFARTLTETRLEHARYLLKNQSLSIKEVSIQCGYQDPNYFSRAFKTYTGLTPLEYQEKELNHED